MSDGPPTKKSRPSYDPPAKSLIHQHKQPSVVGSSEWHHQQKQKHAEFRKNLPVYARRKDILRLVATKDVVLVVAETGSGKSTQIPAYLHESGLLSKGLTKNGQSICVTQPRRVAAMTIARRVAEELGCVPGTAVGYRVRFDDCTDKHGLNTTKVMYATDGMLLREATSDPLLCRYGIVVLDEAHERSLQTDVLFGVVQRAMKARLRNREVSVASPNESKDEAIQRRLQQLAQQIMLPPLKVIVMSATLDIETFQRFFPDAALIQIPGRQYPVQLLYTREPQDDYVDAALCTALQIHEEAEDGDVLIFLPGQEEIEDLAALLRKHLEDTDQALGRSITESRDVVQSFRGIGTDLFGGRGSSCIVNTVMVCVMYAALPPEAQMMAFQPKPEGCIRKIILATNIAETSVTLDGIRYVVDCGKHKIRDFSGATGMESLTVQDISKAQAAQRAGRAGRVSAGICFRLYTENAFDSLAECMVPEIARVNLAQVVLQLKGMGVQDPFNFDFLTPPNVESLKQALQVLYALGALDDKMDLTSHGKKMAKLPLDPIFAHLLLLSPTFHCTSDMLTAVSMLSAENVFYRPGGESGSKAAAIHKRFSSHEGDLPTLLTVYNAWRREAIFIPPTQGGRKAQRKQQKQERAAIEKGTGRLLHNEWCMRNFINGRALTRVFDVRHQLREICSRDVEKNGLSLDVEASCGNDIEPFLKCACAGLFLQSASRIKKDGGNFDESGKSGLISSDRGRYRTKIGRREVSIHPASVMFGRNPAPKCVVFTEMLVTTRAYIRGVTQIREEWLMEFAPKFFGKP